MTWKILIRWIIGWGLIAASISWIGYAIRGCRRLGYLYPEYDIGPRCWYTVVVCMLPIGVIGISAGILTLIKRWRWML